ncbi:hypothetical protein F5882DRAFT_82402 [Hyaloscypha sp. PMI_1271]|nr:hypothetical protein F5882DRAFT_82402 [Hyaloscypha sp. PMI_1271]
MSPTTRSQRLETPPPQRSRGIQANTIKKGRFFNAWDTRDSTDTLGAICKATDTTQITARRWLKQREQIGSPALRRTRKLSNRLGRKSKVSDETYKMLVSPSRNPSAISSMRLKSNSTIYRLKHVNSRPDLSKLQREAGGSNRHM